MKIGSLFSGYGGLDMGVQSVLGGEVAWHVEYDKAPSAILAHHWPDVPNYGDVTAVDFTQLEPVDVLTGGYPCQPFSHAGKRKGTDDVRHLWPHVLRAIRDLGPRLVVLENVRGHLTLGFDTVLADLASVGWSAEWGLVRASDAGACHQRARLFIVAYANDSAHDWEWPRAQSRRGDQVVAYAERERHDRRGVAGAARRQASGRADVAGLADHAPDAARDGRPEGRAGSGGRAWGGRQPASNIGATPDPVYSGWNGRAPQQERGQVRRVAAAGTSQDVPPDASGQRHGQGQDARGVGRLDGEDAGGAREWQWTREVAGDRGGRADWGDYAAAIARWECVLGRPAPAPTEPGRTGQPRLAPAFVEWMMGLPEGHVTDPAIGISRNDQLKALGNGVVPQQAALALSLLLPRIGEAAA